MKRIELLLLRCLVFLFSITPFPVLYLLSDGLCFLMFYVLRYRRKVIVNNLKIAFPQQSKKERESILRAYYSNLCDVILESIKGLSLNEKTLKDRYHYSNPEIIDNPVTKHKSVLLLGGHFTNWEWGVLSVSLWLKNPVMGVFKPLNNPLINEYLNKKRKRFGLQLSSMNKMGRAIVQQKDKPTVFVLIADQTPSDTKNAHWVSFFNQDTPFLQGPDRIAQSRHYPVFGFNITRLKRGYYQVDFEVIASDPQKLKPQEITKCFAKHLEKQIHRHPSDWLWSHRRWKHSKRKE